MPKVAWLDETVTILSKIDLQKGYQIPLNDDSKDVTAFVTPWGCFRCNVLPFGLRNAPAIFQAIMVKVLRSCDDCSVVYIDDIFIFSDSLKDHVKDFQKVLIALRKAGLKGKKSKCQ